MRNGQMLNTKDLFVSFKTYAGIVQAVRGVSFELEKGETLALVGESGCGKTVTAKALMGLLPNEQVEIGGEVGFHGENLLEYGEDEMTKIRGKHISMIFQDPMTALNPTMRIGDQIAESIIIHEQKTHAGARAEALEMLELVKIANAKERMNQYPFEMSGGMRQRVMIALALACNPEILIADEPTTALDVTIQAEILELIMQLQREREMGVILITHDMGVVASISERIHVMYAGKIVEEGSVREVFYGPKHPYTFALMRSVPELSSTKQEPLYSIIGTPPDLINPPQGCPFAPRCEFAMKICKLEPPTGVSCGETQRSYCWLHHPDADITGVPEVLQGRSEAHAR